MRNLCVLAGGIVLVLGMTGCSGDANKGKQEAAMTDSVKILGEYADAIESVKDKQTGKEAAVKINTVCDKMEALAASTSTLPKVENKAEFDKFMTAKVIPEMEKVMKRASKDKVANAVVLSGGDESFTKAMERWGPAFNKLLASQKQLMGK